MTIPDLTLLFDYLHWARARLFDVIAELSPAQLTRVIAGGHGSIRNTLVHVLSAEWGWLERCGGFERGPRLEPNDFPTLESIVEKWSVVQPHLQRFLAGLTDADLQRAVGYAGVGGAMRSMPLGDLLLHAALHAVHHQGQIALLVRESGLAPSKTDPLLFLGERRGVVAW